MATHSASCIGSPGYLATRLGQESSGKPRPEPLKTSGAFSQWGITPMEKTRPCCLSEAQRAALGPSFYLSNIDSPSPAGSPALVRAQRPWCVRCLSHGLAWVAWSQTKLNHFLLLCFQDRALDRKSNSLFQALRP